MFCSELMNLFQYCVPLPPSLLLLRIYFLDSKHAIYS